eukprot:CAMPEP_0194270714 /NCGR_PEP_ID=MMETSP0169-20130528/4643_1 /TAXON_ID=218684 /ORGANISM="Corethron pennatum, Strain L29A3" /LENGTH=140 /DNA_ID=CAMNT_0039012851 /DNA_START=1179 /DNA_END=1601 /DNA_ORIENTATION=-
MLLRDPLRPALSLFTLPEPTPLDPPDPKSTVSSDIVGEIVREKSDITESFPSIFWTTIMGGMTFLTTGSFAGGNGIHCCGVSRVPLEESVDTCRLLGGLDPDTGKLLELLFFDIDGLKTSSTVGFSKGSRGKEIFSATSL